MNKLLISTLILISTLLPVMAFGQAVDLAKAVGELTDKLVSASKGEVVGVEGDSIYINLGQKDGILEGNKLEVVRLGEPLRGGIGYKETIVGEVEVTRVRETASITKVLQKSGEIKDGDRVYQLRKKVTRVAVTEFPFGDKFNDLTRNVQDILYTNLVQKGMSMVEREKLEEVLREQKMGSSGVIDLSTAAQMGKILGVEAVLLGSVSDLGNSLAIFARLVDVETAVPFTAARVEVAKTPMLADLLAKGIRGPREVAAQEQGRPAGGGKGDAHASMEKAGQRQKWSVDKVFEHKGFVFKLGTCEILKDRKVQCAFVYRNTSDQAMQVKFGKNVAQSFMLDDLGNKSGLVGSTAAILIDTFQPFPPNMDVAGRITWEKLAEEATTVSFSLSFYVYEIGGHSGFQMPFLAIPIKTP